MILNFTKLHSDVPTPKYQTNGAAGFDLTVDSFDPPSMVAAATVKYRLGVSVQIPVGYVGLLVPRSSVSKLGWMMSNSVGVIDSDYRGELCAVFTIIDEDMDLPYQIGDRCAQLVIVPAPQFDLVETDDLDETDRGTGGFGSTGVA